MKINRLVICNTYYQLIVAIQLKMALWKEHNVTVIITDQSRNSEQVSVALQEQAIFERVLFIKTKELCLNSESIIKKICNVKYVLMGIREHKEIQDAIFDELIYYNADIFTYGLYAKLRKKNRNILCARYEEGIFSYHSCVYLEKSNLKYVDKIREIFNMGTLEESTKTFYCFHPGSYQGKLNCIGIPKIINLEAIGEVLGKIFSISGLMIDIKEKYIFFTSVYDFEGENPIGEFEIVSKIAAIVGINNLLVKTHPRDTRTIYEENGFHVYKGSSVPWEAIQLNGNFSDKCFLTVNSGSVVSINSMVKDSVRTFFVYNCCDISKNNLALKSVKEINQILEELTTEINNVYVVDSVEQLGEWLVL